MSLRPTPGIASVLLFSLHIAKCLSQDQQSCYFPNGSPDPTGVPCNTSAEDSHCCSSRGLCLSNGLCFLQTATYTNRISRQSCTDRSWESPNCPQYCTDTYDGQGTTIWLGPENPNGAFCCGQPYNVSSDECVLGTQGSTQPFNLSPGYVYFDREGKNSTDPAAFGVTDAASSATASVTAPLVAATSPAVKGDGNDGCNTTAVGAGVGVPLGVLLVAAVGLLIWQCRKSKSLQKRLDELQGYQSVAAEQANQSYKDQSNAAWGSGMASPAPAYAEPRKSEAPGDGPGGYQAGELPAMQQEISELGSGR